MRIDTSKVHNRIEELRQRLIEAEEEMEGEVEGSPAWSEAEAKTTVFRDQIEFLENLIS